MQARRISASSVTWTWETSNNTTKRISLPQMQPEFTRYNPSPSPQRTDTRSPQSRIPLPQAREASSESRRRGNARSTWPREGKKSLTMRAKIIETAILRWCRSILTALTLWRGARTIMSRREQLPTLSVTVWVRTTAVARHSLRTVWPFKYDSLFGL